MYKPINGWTKTKMIKRIMKRNKGRVSIEKDFCKYESEDGNHCAIGCFIPKGHKAMKAKECVGVILNNYPNLIAKMPLEFEGLNELQLVHDLCNSGDKTDPRPAMVEWIKKNVESVK